MSEKRDVVKKIVDYCKEIKLFCFAIVSVKLSGSQGGYPFGYKKSMPDLCMPILSLYIEAKDDNPGTVREHEEKQAARHEELREAGQFVERCEGFEAAKKIIDMCLAGNYELLPSVMDKKKE